MNKVIEHYGTIDIRHSTIRVQGRIVCSLPIGVEGLKIVNSFQFDRPEDRNDMAKIIQKFDQFTIGKPSKCIISTQEIKKTTNPWMLMSPPSTCATSGDFIVSDRIVLNIKVKQTRNRLWQEKKWTLKACIDLCKSSEARNAPLKTISGSQQFVAWRRRTGQNVSNRTGGDGSPCRHVQVY